MLRILGRISSVNVQKVVWCADELGLAYERVDVGGTFGGNDTPDYLAKNPNGLVPVIEDDGFVLYESNAIVRYLAAKHAEGTLWPRDPRQRADVDRWMEWQSTGYTPAMLVAFWQLVPHAAGEARRRGDRGLAREGREVRRGARRATSPGATSSRGRPSRQPTSAWAARRTAGWACRCEQASRARTSSVGMPPQSTARCEAGAFATGQLNAPFGAVRREDRG